MQVIPIALHNSTREIRVQVTGAAVIAAAISPYEETRQKARELVEEWGTFVEVHVATGLPGFQIVGLPDEACGLFAGFCDAVQVGLSGMSTFKLRLDQRNQI